MLKKATVLEAVELTEGEDEVYRLAGDEIEIKEDIFGLPHSL